MTSRMYLILAFGGSIALLMAAFAFQHLGGLPPCKMCIWQRWPHVAAIALGSIALVIPARGLAWLGMIAALVTAGIGGYHTGVERGWWEGPSTCSAGDTSGLTVDQLMDQILNAPLVRCDEVAWQMFGLSMASWNMLASLALALLWLMAARTMKLEYN